MTDEVVNTQPVETAGSPVSESVSEAPDTPVLPVEEYSNHRVPVKLDGEELQVPLSEAIAGYQRQADYTRKTQELAQQREQFQFASALQTALETDPAATIDLLSKHYGISRQAAADMVADGEDFEMLDPVEQRYRELDKRIATFEDYQTQQQVERYPACQFEMDVRQGEFVLVGAYGENATTMGCAWFRQPDPRGSVQRLLVIRTARMGGGTNQNTAKVDGPRPLALLAQEAR